MLNSNYIAPAHIGIIPSGNGRWAAERHLLFIDGHLKGFEKIFMSAAWFLSKGAKTISYYLFSLEDWSREAEEINSLMKLYRQSIEEAASVLKEKNVRLLFSGRIEELPGDLPGVCQAAVDSTKNGEAGAINICLNYGGREEIVEAFRRLIKNKIGESQVHEGLVKKYLYNGELTDPDCIIRTGGIERLSGFMLWQNPSSELIFLKKNWPEFELADVEYILNEYSKRKTIK